MALSEYFKKRLASTLKNKLKSYHILEIKPEYENIIYDISSIYSDFRVGLAHRNIEIYLEIERHRPDPVHNLIKTLIWHGEHNPDNPIILLHVFDEAYYSDDSVNRKMCDYVYSKLRNEYSKFCYHTYNISGLVSQGSKQPTTKGSKLLAGKLCKQIGDRIALLIEKTGKTL